MVKKISLWILWVGLIAYAVLFAPPNQPDTLALIQNLSLGQWQAINPLIVALFNLMGVWPMIYAGVLATEGRAQAVPVWPFMVASFFVGAFALLPYLALRQDEPTWDGSLNRVGSVLVSRWTGLLLSVIAIALLAFGITQGNWPDFWHQWQTNRFIHVMSLDFCLLTLLFPLVLADDMARRNWFKPARFWVIALVPLLGPLCYLCIRPPLPSSESVT